METLRIFTAGSVDDGKSTLIGRLLYDSKSIFEDQMDAIKLASRNKGEDEVNLAYLTDGLRSEREQGITIDVAYRYFSTPKRSFIIADTPGHAQYTRNMATGASTADVGIVLIDACNGVLEQTIRHIYISKLLGIRHLIIAVNKMDLVDYSEEIFVSIVNGVNKYVADTGNVYYIPMSARNGDNVVTSSENMQWYHGIPLLEYLETVAVDSGNALNFFMTVQYVIRPNHRYRGYAGQVVSGCINVGDEIMVLPDRIKVHIKGITNCGVESDCASDGQSVAIELDEDYDIARGSVLCIDNGCIKVGTELTMDAVCFFDDEIMIGGKYTILHNGMETVAIVKELKRIDINTGSRTTVNKLAMNDIASVTVKTAQPIVYTHYGISRAGGSLIFVNENNTVMAGMINNE